MSPSRPCFYLICCDCHMLMSDYSAWGTTPRWTRKQNALLGIFLRLGKMFLKQMHPESDLQHFPSQAWVSRGDDESLECFFMQHMTFEKKQIASRVIANLVWASFGGSVFHFQHLWTHAHKAVLSSDKHLSWAVSRWSASPQNVMAAAGRKDVVSLPMSHHVVLKACLLILDCVFAAASSHLECFHTPEHSHVLPWEFSGLWKHSKWQAYCEGLKAQGLSVDIIPVDKDDWCWSSQNGMAHCMCTKTILVEPSLLLGIRWWVRWSRKWVQRWYSKAADARFSTAHTHRHTRIQKQRHAQGRKNACRRVGLAFIWSAVIVTC